MAGAVIAATMVGAARGFGSEYDDDPAVAVAGGS